MSETRIQNLLDYYSKIKNEYEIEGKRITEWNDFATVKLPREISPEEIRALTAEIANRYQEVQDAYNIYNFMNNKLKVEEKEALQAAKAQLIKDNSKMGADKITTMALEKISGTTWARQQAEMIAQFLRELRDKLNITARALEHIEYSQNNEIRNLSRIPYEN